MVGVGVQYVVRATCGRAEMAPSLLLYPALTLLDN